MNSGSKLKRPSWMFWLLAGAISLFAIWGISRVPFHPDESTYLFMSADFDQFTSNPASMAWEAGKGMDERLRYRLIDAPITRYLLGSGRSVAGLPALPVDWSWPASWEENRNAGAMPEEKLLWAGRLAITLLLPFSLFFIYLIGRRMGGEASGLLAVFLLGSNALILLHNRRAMTEGAFTFGVIFALWSFLEGRRRPWLAGLGMALAFNAKHSGLALLPAGLLAVAWELFRPEFGPATSRIKKGLTNILIFGAVFGAATLALNPFLWRDPLGAAQATLKERNALLERQLADTLRLAPEKAMITPGQRGMSLMANLFILPPAFAEVNQYHAYTKEAEISYLATPGHNLLRGMGGAAVTLGLFLLGVGLALVDFRYKNAEKRRVLVLVGLATISQVVMLMWAVPLTWQRYVIPLAPMVCLWSAYPASRLQPRERAPSAPKTEK